MIIGLLVAAVLDIAVAADVEDDMERHPFIVDIENSVAVAADDDLRVRQVCIEIKEFRFVCRNRSYRAEILSVQNADGTLLIILEIVPCNSRTGLVVRT